MAGAASYMTAQIDAATLLLKASAVWNPSHLAAAITKIIIAKPPPNCTPSAATVFYQSQSMFLTLLLNHCHAPPAIAGDNASSFLHIHIKAALVAGAPPGVLDLLLARAPNWRPTDLRETDAQGTATYNWARETSNYIQLFPVMVRMAVKRCAVSQLMPALLALAQPFQRGMNSDRGGYAHRISYFLRALAECRAPVQDMLPAVKEAASTRNLKLLLALAAANKRFRWPAAQLAPLLPQLAGGTEEYDVATLKVVLKLGEGFSPPHIALAVAAAAEKAKSAPYLEARGLTQRMCDPMCAGGNWNVVAATAAALNLPDAAALLKKLYSASGGSSMAGSTPAAVDLTAAASAAGHILRLQTGAGTSPVQQPVQQQKLPPLKLGRGQGVVSSAAAAAVLAATSAARSPGWSGGHGAVITQVALPAPADAASAGSEADTMALVVPPVVTTAAKPPVSPGISARKSASMPSSPEPLDLNMPAAQEKQQQQQQQQQPQAGPAAAASKHLMPPPPNKVMPQHQPLPSASARQPGQAAAVAHSGSMAAPCTLEHSPSEELLAIAAATLATFKESSVASLHHNTSDRIGRLSPAPQSPAAASPHSTGRQAFGMDLSPNIGAARKSLAAASPRSNGRPAFEMHLNPNMSAAQILSAVAPRPGSNCKGSPCSPMSSDTSPFSGSKAARELRWQQLVQHPVQQPVPGATGCERQPQQQQQQPSEQPIPLDLPTQTVLFQLFMQAAAAAAAPAVSSADVEPAGGEQPQPRQEGAPSVGTEPESKAAGDDAASAAAASSILASATTATAAARQENEPRHLAPAAGTAASVSEPMHLDGDDSTEKHGVEQASCPSSVVTGQVAGAAVHCSEDGPDAKRQRV
uniref:Uncharacterized protein n=1 Tax=Tetradesmus obliquus TaxID=3088 RepID=A0A383WM58_TETOB|eukprot:jgi/Sobl393_1/19075/SZX77816.1